MEKSNGVFSRDDREGYFNDKSIEELREGVELLLASDIIPMDVQFMIFPTGSIQFIDFDLYITPLSVKENPSIAYHKQMTLLQLASGETDHMSSIHLHRNVDDMVSSRARQEVEPLIRERLRTLIASFGAFEKIPSAFMHRPKWATEPISLSSTERPTNELPRKTLFQKCWEALVSSKAK